ncbi:MAG: hypothetical protein H7Y00_09990, partial [Fimbriimonadaceae bacterium]|nr:hypothetical protein [Chitinophagales bacterium]
IILVVAFLVIRLIFDFNGLFGQDGYEYVKIERGIKNYFSNDMVIPYSVFPIGYGLAGFLFSLLIPADIFAMQIISLLSLFIACIYLRKLITSIHNTEFKVDLFVILFFILSPYVLRFGILVMSDMLCIATYLIFVYHTFKFLTSFHLKNLILLSIAGACCIYIRYASVVVLIIPACIILYHILKSKKFILLFVPIFIFLLISIPEYFLRDRFIFWNIGETKTGFAYFYVPEQWSFSNFFKRDFSNLDGLQHYNIPNIIFAFQNFIHPAFIFIGILFIFFLRKSDLQKKEIQICLTIIILYALFAAGYPYQSNRYLLFTFPLILILFYPAFSRLYQLCTIPQWMKILGITLSAALQVFLFVYSFQTIYHANKNEKAIAEELKNYPGKNIYTFSIDGALNTYEIDYIFYDMYGILFDTIKPNSLLLFNEDAFAVQFAELNPMKNYHYMKSSYELEVLKEFSDGWKLYSIK